LSPEDARIAAAGLTGEVRDLISRELVSLSIGTAMLMQGGGTPQRLRIPFTESPNRLSAREKDIIERIRKNVGAPLDLTGGAMPAPSAKPAKHTTAKADTPPAPVTPPKPAPTARPKPRSTKKITGGFVEGDV